MRRTSSYVMTVEPDNQNHIKKLKEVRKAVKVINSDLRNHRGNYVYNTVTNEWETLHETDTPRQYYVKCQGRFGKKNPHLHKYTYDNYYGSGNSVVDWSICRLDDAQRWDVYIYTR